VADIILSGSIRENLLALQRTTDLMSRTQTRLATGKKINSALDNPNAFFTAQGLTNRAKDLANLLDGIGQAIQTIKAANEGVTAIVTLVEAAKAKANQAQQTTNTFTRAKYVEEYNELLNQIQKLAEDSGYNGKNLLGGTGNELTVYLNEDSSNFLTIASIGYTDIATLGLAPLTAATMGTLAVDLEDGSANPLSLSSLMVSDAAQFDAGGNTLTFEDSGGNVIGTLTVTDTMTVGEFVTQVNANFSNIRASFANGTLTFEASEEITITGGAAGGALANSTIVATASDWHTDGGLASTLSSLTDALDLLRAQASTFGTSLTIVQDRQNFTKSFIGMLAQGSDMLTVADTNEEGANLLALQTRQQLSITALSLATQADQSVLRLFA
jgi:flagellin-like hook-associated protein FlgL